MQPVRVLDLPTGLRITLGVGRPLPPRAAPEDDPPPPKSPSSA